MFIVVLNSITRNNINNPNYNEIHVEFKAIILKLVLNYSLNIYYYINNNQFILQTPYSSYTYHWEELEEQLVLPFLFPLLVKQLNFHDLHPYLMIQGKIAWFLCCTQSMPCRHCLSVYFFVLCILGVGFIIIIIILSPPQNTITPRNIPSVD